MKSRQVYLGPMPSVILPQPRSQVSLLLVPVSHSRSIHALDCGPVCGVPQVGRAHLHCATAPTRASASKTWQVVLAPNLPHPYAQSVEDEFKSNGTSPLSTYKA